MARQSKPISGKRFANWICVVMGPILVALTLASPQPRSWWQFLGIATWTLVAIRSAHWLATDRPPAV